MPSHDVRWSVTMRRCQIALCVLAVAVCGLQGMLLHPMGILITAWMVTPYVFLYRYLRDLERSRCCCRAVIIGAVLTSLVGLMLLVPGLVHIADPNRRTDMLLMICPAVGCLLTAHAAASTAKTY